RTTEITRLKVEARLKKENPDFVKRPLIAYPHGVGSPFNAGDYWRESARYKTSVITPPRKGFFPKKIRYPDRQPRFCEFLPSAAFGETSSELQGALP
ncbi:hypothetical protein GWI33_007485, partial [Rhynchophorus ferrugineus]